MKLLQEPNHGSHYRDRDPEKLPQGPREATTWTQRSYYMDPVKLLQEPNHGSHYRDPEKLPQGPREATTWTHRSYYRDQRTN